MTPGSGIRDRDTGSESGMNIPDHISESLEKFGLKILKFFDADADPGAGKF